jgi:hypothetical protein
MNYVECATIIDRVCDLTEAIVISLDGKAEADIDVRLSRDLDNFRG